MLSGPWIPILILAVVILVGVKRGGWSVAPIATGVILAWVLLSTQWGMQFASATRASAGTFSEAIRSALAGMGVHL